MRRAFFALIFSSSFLAAPVSAQNEKFGDWAVMDLDDGTAMALVRNSADSAFGTVCTAKGCHAFLSSDLNCDDGDQYVSLVNSPASAFAVVLTCERTEKRSFFTTPLEGEMVEAMAVGGVLGIAFPMQSGAFKVSRFSLTGAARASARAAQIASAPTGTKKQNTSDDFSL